MKWENVLVVDDDEAFCRLMASHLQRHGYEVERCANGTEALEALRAKGSFQVMVADLVMPGMSGTELLRRARKIDPELEVIVITGEGTLETAVAALREDGAYDYLTKPLEMIGDLSLAVGRAMTHRRLTSEKEALRLQAFIEVERLRTLAAVINEAVIIADASGMLILVNPLAARLVGRNIQPGAEAFTSLPEFLVTPIVHWQTGGATQPLAVEVVVNPNLKLTMSLTPLRDVDLKPQGWVMVLRPT